MPITFEDRARGLEEAYFRAKNAEATEKLRAKLAGEQEGLEAIGELEAPKDGRGEKNGTESPSADCK